MSSSETPELTSSPPMQGERVVFTGTLASMTHRQAHELVEQSGGQATAQVSRHTSIVVVGEEGWPLEADGKMSVKLRQALEFLEQGHSIRILKESDWLCWLGLEDRQQGLQRLHTPASLQQLLGIPANLVRRWERLGLIHAEQRVYRLPYFDFREVAGVRRLQELLQSGISRTEIERSLTAIEHILPTVKRPIAQLEILERDTHVVIRDESGLLDPRDGQRLFDFEPEPESASVSVEEPLPILSLQRDEPVRETDQVHWSIEQWVEQASHCLETDDVPAAIDALRMALMDAPSDPELHFQLADALFRSNNLPAALERLHVAVEHDHDYIEAWTQMGCVQALLGQAEQALQAFDIALSIHPTYAEAMFHKASVLFDQGRHFEARRLWRQYLEHDQRGPWADTARQQLESGEE